MQFHTRQMIVNDIFLNVVIEGEGPDVLLVHGFPDDHQVWRKQIPALVAAGYRVIAPDMRGCGCSYMPPQRRAYQLDHLVNDLLALLDNLGIEQVRLVGHDWGAVICWALCMRHGARVSRYASLSVGHPTAYARAPLKQKLRAYYIALFQLRGLAEGLLRLANWRVFGWLTGCDEEFPLWVAKLKRPGRLRAAINYYRANVALLMPGLLPNVPMAVLGLWSDGDRYLCEEQMLNTERFVDGAWRYERIDGAGHWLQLEAPERVNQLLLGFLA